MNPNQPFERDLEHWLQAEAPTAAPAGLHAAVIDRARSRRQRPGWAASGLARWLGRNRGLTLFAAAALLLLGGALAVGSGPEPNDVSQLDVANPPLPTTPDAWSRTRPENGPAHTHAISTGGPGLVAVGAHDAEDDEADIWTSTDGRAWSRVPGEQLGPGVINDVSTGGPGLVAVGRALRTGADTIALGAAIWTSRDGLAWIRLPDDAVFDRPMSAVTAGGPGLVAVGWNNRAWFSSDGLTWELASVPPVPPDVYPGDDGAHPQVTMRDVAAAGDRLVAIGSALMNDNSEEGVMWTSADGMAWTNVPLHADVFPDGSVDSVAGGPDGFIAIVDDGTGPDPIRFSPDGLRWHRVGTEQGPFRSTQPDPDTGTVSVRSVTAASGGYVAVGSDGTCNHVGECVSSEAAVWTSPDGRSWLRVPTGPAFRSSVPATAQRSTGADHVFAWGSGFLVLGSFDGEGAIWTSAPSQ